MKHPNEHLKVVGRETLVNMYKLHKREFLLIVEMIPSSFYDQIVSFIEEDMSIFVRLGRFHDKRGMLLQEISPVVAIDDIELEMFQKFQMLGQQYGFKITCPKIVELMEYETKVVETKNRTKVRVFRDNLLEATTLRNTKMNKGMAAQLKYLATGMAFGDNDMRLLSTRAMIEVLVTPINIPVIGILQLSIDAIALRIICLKNDPISKIGNIAKNVTNKFINSMPPNNMLQIMSVMIGNMPTINLYLIQLFAQTLQWSQCDIDV